MKRLPLKKRAEMSWLDQIKQREEMRRFRPAYQLLKYSRYNSPGTDTSETARIRRARDRGCRWLLFRLQSDGGMRWAYHKVLNALEVCGENRAANRLCNWIVAHEMTPEGDFGKNPSAKKEKYIYKNAWIVLGAQWLGRYEISQKGMDFILCFRDPASGGFYSSPIERDASSKQDLKVVGYCGLAALATGKMDIARDVGRWLRMLMQAQPCFPQKLYTVYSRAEGLHTTPDPHDVLRYVVLSDAPDDEYFFQIGIAGGFLARLYQATGESEWLALAIEYMRFAEIAIDSLFRSVRAGKVGWAAALLFTLTGERKYNAMALRVAAMLIDTQARMGSWNAPEVSSPDADVTAEMVVWLDEIYQAVASH